MSLIIKRSAATIYTIDVDEKTVLRQSLQGEDKITSQFSYPSLLALQLGDYTEFDGRTYTINRLPEIKKTGSDRFNYNIQFEGEIYDLNDATLRHEGVSDFTYFGTAQDYIDLIASNINRIKSGWTTGTVTNTEKAAISFSGDTCRTSLKKIADYFKFEFSIAAKAISLQRSVGSATGLTFTYGRGNGLYSLDRKNFDSGNIVTRLYGLGSTKNIDYTYGQKRLGFSAEYLDNNTGTYGIKEGEIIFEDIFPQRTGTISAIDSNLLIFRDSGIDFNINNQLIEGETAKVVFKTGNLAGYEFEIQQYTESTDELLLIQFKDADGTVLPNSTSKVQVGDTYTLVNIKMPASYITTAETALQSATQAELNKQSVPRVLYGLNFDWRKLKADTTTLEIGDSVHITDSDLGIDDDIRITGVEFPIVSIYKIKANVSNYVPYTRQERQAIDTADNATNTDNVDVKSTENFRLNSLRQKGDVYQGKYNPATSYFGTTTRKDIVKYSGIYYIAKNRLESFSNKLPTNIDYWEFYSDNLSFIMTDIKTDISGKRMEIIGDDNNQKFYNTNGDVVFKIDDDIDTGQAGTPLGGAEARNPTNSKVSYFSANGFFNNGAGIEFLPGSLGIENNACLVGLMQVQNTDPSGIAAAIVGMDQTHEFRFTVSGVIVEPTFGAIYSNNSAEFIVRSVDITAGSGFIYCDRNSGTNNPTSSGTLTKISGTGDSSISFSISLVYGDSYAAYFSGDMVMGGVGYYLRKATKYIENASYTVLDKDEVITVKTTAGIAVMTLPTSPNEGKPYTFFSHQDSTQIVRLDGGSINIVRSTAVSTTYDLTAKKSITIIFAHGEWRTQSLQID